MNKHFRLMLPDEGTDIYMPYEGQTWGYRYGPSIMVHDGICEAWFASPGDGYEADWFTYRRSEDGGKNWTNERVVLTPTPNSMDWFSVCDPAVIKYGKYYYIGYTSTIFANGGGVCNNGFIARSESPTGPFEKWTGNGWGEVRECDGRTLHWVGKPASVIYYDEDWHNWGAGEFSFVILNDVIYIYYTWTSKDADGKSFSQTRVATADITNENWPLTLEDHGIAAVRTSGANDSYDVVYCEDNGKFISLSTDKRFTADSFLSVGESDDGFRFHTVNKVRANTSFMLHNCGISGDCLHHIKSGDNMLLGYAYGNKWGNWGTRLHKYEIGLMDEDFFSDLDKPSVEREHKLRKRPENIWDINLLLANPHYLRMNPGDQLVLPMYLMNACYEIREAEEGITFDNYDKSIISIDGMTVTALTEGYTYVDAHIGDLFCEFPVFVENYKTPCDESERVLTEFTPMLTTYTIIYAHNEAKQIRGMASYSDGYWFELGGKADAVSYVNHNPGVISVDETGNVRAVSASGTGLVTVTHGGISFDVEVKIV